VRRRLDTELVRRGLAPSREAARALVTRGVVLVGGAAADKPARLVAASDPVVVLDEGSRRFVSRGGEKLDAALSGFALDVGGCRCLDAGASTGGFTDCLLRRGAAAVLAVDVGHGQFDAGLRTHPGVTVLEHTDVRALPTAGGPGAGPFDVVVADLSFISLVTVAPVLLGSLVAPGAELVVLVKPQFEAGRVEASRGRGVIRQPELRRAALERVASALASHGASIMGAMASPLLGPAGNAEFFLHVRAPARSAPVPGQHATPGSEQALRSAWSTMLDTAVNSAPDAAPRDSVTEDAAPDLDRGPE
jgi:23S rRNA (cytidine1920-2'-O)/16S rRNA (cytidine1409-2'-O)-methyltransferase